MTELVVLTGASGAVGTMLRPYLLSRFGRLRLTDLVPPRTLTADETFVRADLTGLEAALEATRGADAVVHLAGLPGEGTWERVIAASMITTVNALEAARINGVGRFVFASSNHVIGYYPRTRRLTAEERVLPDSRYGVAKVFGEGALALYAEKYGMKCMSIRIGTVIDRPRMLRELSTFHHPEDLAQLIAIGVQHPQVGNEIVWGQSDNARSWWDNSRAEALGYRPMHRAEDHLAFAMEGEARQTPDAEAAALQGGGMIRRD